MLRFWDSPLVQLSVARLSAHPHRRRADISYADRFMVSLEHSIQIKFAPFMTRPEDIYD